MTHCTIDHLTDHLLGQTGEEAGERVSGHLASGCRRCNRLFVTLARIRRIGRFDVVIQPPDGVVRAVKELGGVLSIDLDPLFRPAKEI